MNSLAIPSGKQFLPATWFMLLGFSFLIAYFNIIDVYHQQFFSQGWVVVFYNTLRVFYIACLIWLFYAVGDAILSFVSGKMYRSSLTLENALLGFFTGVGSWHIVLLLVGFAGLYHRFFIASIALTVFIASLPRLDQWLRYLSKSQTPRYWPGLGLVLIASVAFLITKGLYPAGGHDYYNHYFHFYRRVTESGSILPNEVWYHFYYSKGAALFFLSMLLTDPLAPQLATTALIAAGTAMVYALLSRSTTWRLWPWLGVFLYLLYLSYTPGPVANLDQGGWADLEKLHEPIAVLMLAIIWITSRLADPTVWKPFSITLLFTVSALCIVNPFACVIGGAYLSMATLVFIRQKHYAAAKVTGLSTLIAGGWLLMMWIINYLLTGLPDDQNLLLFWSILRFDKIKQWGLLYDVATMYFDRTSNSLHQISFSLNLIWLCLSYLRLDVWLPLLIVALCYLRSSTLRRVEKTAFYSCAGFLLLVFLLSLVLGRGQPISYYRFTSFTYAPMLCCCLLLLSASIHHWRKGIIAIVMWVALTVAFSVLQHISSLRHFNPALGNAIQTVVGKYRTNHLQAVFANSLKFVTGRMSIADAYKHQEGWPSRLAWGGIYPAAEEIWKQLPRKTRIWSMHVHSYCMLPDCHMEGFGSFRFSPHADVVFYGNPQEAKFWLKQEHLDYFFFSTNLVLKDDPLPLSPLFSPAHIADYLGIAWTNGQDTLLTWKEQARFPIDAAWVSHYQQSVDASPIKQRFPFAAVKAKLAVIK